MWAAVAAEAQVGDDRKVEPRGFVEREAAAGNDVGVGEGRVAVGGLHDDELRAGRDADVAAGGEAIAGGEAVRRGDAAHVRAVAVEVELCDRRRGGRSAGVLREGGVDVGGEPDCAAVVVGELGVERAAVVVVVEDGGDARRAVGVAQVGVTEVGAGVDDRDERAGAVEAGGEARGRRVDGGAGGVEEWMENAALLDGDDAAQGDEAAQIVRGGAQISDVAGERAGVEAGATQRRGTAGDAHGHERAPVAGAARRRADTERGGGKTAGGDEPDAADDRRRREGVWRDRRREGEINNERERTAHLEATRHGMLSDGGACGGTAGEPRRGARRRRRDRAHRARLVRPCWRGR